MSLPNYDAWKTASPYDTPEAIEAQRIGDKLDDAAWRMKRAIAPVLLQCDWLSLDGIESDVDDGLIIDVALSFAIEPNGNEGGALAAALREVARCLDENAKKRKVNHDAP